MERSIQEHRLLLKACEKGDLRQIRETVRSHYRQAVDFLLKKLVPSTSSKLERPKEKIRGKRKEARCGGSKFAAKRKEK
jgi:hypothetical protein